MEFCAPCLFGIEGILGDELKRLHVENVRVENGRVLFSGDYSTLAKVNIQSRYAERVQILLSQFKAYSFEDLFQGVKAISWKDYLAEKDSFPVKGWALESTLHSVPDCQAIVKKAIVSNLSKAYGTEWFEETGPKHQVQFTILKDQVSILLDTSGPSLHKRGYRAVSLEAPLKETLAAAIADLTRARTATTIIDPFCGSGTLLIEAALASHRIAPGIARKFAAQDWEQIPKETWKQEKDLARSFENHDKELHLIGMDIDDGALTLTKENLEKAKIDAQITLKNQDIKDFVPEGESGTVLCNPPYGERLLDAKAAEELIKTMGKVFIPKKGWSYAIISPHEEFETLFGRKATKRRKLYNGMLRCTLYMYF